MKVSEETKKVVKNLNRKGFGLYGFNRLSLSLDVLDSGVASGTDNRLTLLSVVTGPEQQC